MTKPLTKHGCGKSWLQRGERTGHCGGCHNTFEGNALFDAHFERMADGRVHCKNPAEMTYKKEPLVFDGTYGDGAWSAARTIFDPKAIWGDDATRHRRGDSGAPDSANSEGEAA